MMEKLKYTYQNWNRAYYELQTEEDTCWYYNNFYKTEISRKLRTEKTKDVQTWAQYAYYCNDEFMNRMWEGEFSLKDLDKFNNMVDKVARIFNVTVLLETGQPYAYMEAGGIFATIFFIDEYDRVYMQYSFSNEYKKGYLFLNELEIFIFPKGKVNKRWQNREYISYAFAPNGYFEITKIFDVYGETLTEKYVAKELVNVESNWEPYPEFGKWDSIFRMKRWKEGELAEGFRYPEK